jgi:hypothetical protein
MVRHNLAMFLKHGVHADAIICFPIFATGGWPALSPSAAGA